MEINHYPSIVIVQSIERGAVLVTYITKDAISMRSLWKNHDLCTLLRR